MKPELRKKLFDRFKEIGMEEYFSEIVGEFNRHNVLVSTETGFQFYPKNETLSNVMFCMGFKSANQ